MGDWFEVLVICLVVGGNAWRYWSAYGRLPWFEEYCQRHREAVRRGRCHCHHCGASRIYVHSLTPWWRRHICAQCGEVLYRS